MKKFLFVGGTNGNTGPANVNKGIVTNLSDAFCIADSVNKVKKIHRCIHRCSTLQSDSRFRNV